jgi:hypothetical protein
VWESVRKRDSWEGATVQKGLESPVLETVIRERPVKTQQLEEI